MQPPTHSASKVFAPVAGRKNTTSASCSVTGDDHACTSGVSASADGWKNTNSTSCSRCRPPRVQVEYLHQLIEGDPHQCKVQGQDSTRTSWSRMQQQHATTTTTTTHQIRTNTGAVRVPDAAIRATCIRAHPFTFYMLLCNE